MKYLQITWVRVLISLLSAGILVEFVTISYSTDPNHLTEPDRNGMYTLIIGGIIYFLITPFIKKQNKVYKP